MIAAAAARVRYRADASDADDDGAVAREVQRVHRAGDQEWRSGAIPHRSDRRLFGDDVRPLATWLRDVRRMVSAAPQPAPRLTIEAAPSENEPRHAGHINHQSSTPRILMKPRSRRAL
jgi:hypothetical protein